MDRSQYRLANNRAVSAAQKAGRRVPKTQVISIVDDDRHAREAIETLVQSMGYTTASFESADDFLYSGRINETGCVITDIQMPGKSGFDLQQQLRVDGHQIPVIFITAFPERFSERGKKAGATGFLSKPFRDEDLIDCLARAFGGLSPDSRSSA